MTCFSFSSCWHPDLIDIPVHPTAGTETSVTKGLFSSCWHLDLAAHPAVHSVAGTQAYNPYAHWLLAQLLAPRSLFHTSLSSYWHSHVGCYTEGWFKKGFNKKAVGTVVVRHRAHPNKCTDRTLLRCRSLLLPFLLSIASPCSSPILSFPHLSPFP